jgi:hypothetical protein
MGLRGKLEPLEKRVSAHSTVVRCPVCGEEVRAMGDVALGVLATLWAREMGMEQEPDTAFEEILAHPHVALVDKLINDEFPRSANA